jgi:HEAT repeat protein
MGVLALAVLVAWGSVDGPRPVNVLAAVAKDGGSLVDTRRDAVAELARHATPEAAQVLVLLLDDPPVAAAAAQALRQVAPGLAAPALEAALAHPSAEQRRVVCGLLGEVGQDSSVAALLVVAKAPDEVSPTRQAAVEAVAAVAGRSADVEHARAFLRLLDDPALYRAALGRLRVLQDARFAPVVVPLLTHPKTDVRREACRVLERARSPVAVDALLKVARADADGNVRRAALDALTTCTPSLRVPDVARDLVPLFEDEKVGDAAARAASRLRHPALCGVLGPGLSSSRGRVRKQVAEALGGAGCLDAADALARVADTDPEQVARDAALRALGKVAHTPAHVAAVMRHLADDQWASPAMDALRNIRHPALAPDLFPLLQHANPTVRQLVCAVLGDLAQPAAAGPLLDVVEGDQDPAVVLAAAKAWGYAGTPEALERVERLVDARDRTAPVADALVASHVAVDRLQVLKRLQVLLKRKSPLARRLCRVVSQDARPADEPTLLAAASAADAATRREGLAGLARLRSLGAQGALCKALQADKETGHRVLAAEALGGLALVESVDCLVGALPKVDRRAAPKLAEAVARSLRALTGQVLGDDPAAWKAWREAWWKTWGKGGPGKGTAGLVAALGGEDVARRALAARQVARRPADAVAALPVVLSLLAREEVKANRVDLLEVVAVAGERSAVEVLVALVEGRPAEMGERVALARALEALGDGRGTLPLVEELESEDREVRRQAVRALSLVSGQPPWPQPAAWQAWWKTQEERRAR